MTDREREFSECEIERLVSRHVDDEIDADDQLQLERLLETSAHARALVRQLRELDARSRDAIDALCSVTGPTRPSSIPGSRRASPRQAFLVRAAVVFIAASFGWMLAMGLFDRPDVVLEDRAGPQPLVPDAERAAREPRRVGSATSPESGEFPPPRRSAPTPAVYETSSQDRAGRGEQRGVRRVYGWIDEETDQVYLLGIEKTKKFLRPRRLDL